MRKFKNSQMNQNQINDCSTIAIYGIGSGSHFDALQEWLRQSPHHQLVYFDDENVEPPAKLLNHPQVHIAKLHDPEAHAILTPDFYFLAHPGYEEKAELIYPRLLRDVYTVHAYLAQAWHFKEQANIYYHLAHLNEYTPSKGLQVHGCFIICGAGPSLEDHLELLKHRKGVLVGAGTALNILNDAGIQTDLGVAFDSKLTGARRLQSNSAFSIPFLVDLDATSGVKYLSGPKILTKQGNLEPWKEKLLSQLGIKDELLEIGPSISSTHYAFEVAVKLGAREIMLLGVDLAYLQGKQYAGAKTWLLDEDDPVPIKERKDLIQVESLLASRLFFKEAEIFSELALSHPEVKIYEGSGQGQKIEGIPFKDFSKWEQVAAGPIQKLDPFDISVQMIKKVLMDWKEELQNSPELLLEGYIKRLRLQRLTDDAIEKFCKKVVEYHLSCLDEALQDMEYATGEKHPDEIPFRLDGTVKLYYNNGQLKSQIDYVNGKRNGLYQFYSRSGRLLEEGHYQKGVPTGIYKQWNRQGELEKEVDLRTEVDVLKEELDRLLKEL